MTAEAFFLFLDKKKQKSSQPRCFFTHKAFAHDQVKPRAVIFLPPWSHGGLRFSKKSLCPSLRTAHQFYLLLSEAARLTNSVSKNNTATIKKRKGLSGCAAGCLACELAAISLT
jgi:hypothetical protein